MVFIIDKFCNYLIYIFLIHYCWRIEFRKQPVCLVASTISCIIAGVLDFIFGETIITYLVWSPLAMALLFRDKLWHISVLTVALTWFMGMIDTFSVIVVQIVLFGRADERGKLESWELLAYFLSFSIEFFWYYFVLRKNRVYMDDIAPIYKISILIMTLVFEMVVVYMFYVLYEDQSEYGWYLHLRFGLSLISAIYAITTTLKLAVKNFLFDNQNKQLKLALDAQQNQYLYQKENNLSLRRFRHDLINHIGAIQEYLSMGQYDNASSYIKEVWNVAESLSNSITTGDDNLDAIVNYYAYICNREGISFRMIGRLKKQLEIDMLDATSLIGNALQNAIEATSKVTNKQIRMEIIDRSTEVFISIHNTCLDVRMPSDFKLETSKSDKVNHGFGLKSIISIIEKYAGEYYLSEEEKDGDRMFKLDISIPRGGKL